MPSGSVGNTTEECSADVTHFWKVLHRTMGKWQPAPQVGGWPTNVPLNGGATRASAAINLHLIAFACAAPHSRLARTPCTRRRSACRFVYPCCSSR